MALIAVTLVIFFSDVLRAIRGEPSIPMPEGLLALWVVLLVVAIAGDLRRMTKG